MRVTRRQSLALIAAAAVPRGARGEPADGPGPPPVGPATRPATTRPATVPDTVPATGPGTSAAGLASLRDACDGLLARAVRTPYGWGWSEDEPGADLRRAKPRGKPPAIDAALTAAVGLTLHLYGEVAAEPAYRSAAADAARGTVAVQTRTGQIRARGVMGAFGGTKDDATDVPDRRPTRVALALLLTVMADQDRPDARLPGRARQAANWLGVQQANNGGWATLYPPDAAKGRAVRLLVLDDPDLRDTALAVLLAADAFDDRQLRFYFDRAVDNLTAVRAAAGRPSTRSLWPAACKLDGDPNTRQPGLPTGIDLLGSRHALEVLLAGYLSTLEDKYNAPLKAARDALSALPRDGQRKWHRRYDLQLKPILARPETQPASFFAPPQSDLIAELPDPRAADVFARLERAQAVGGKRMADELAAALPLPRRLALMVAGFAPDALLTDGVGEAAGRSRPDGGDGVGTIRGTVAAAWRDLRPLVLAGRMGR